MSIRLCLALSALSFTAACVTEASAPDTTAGSGLSITTLDDTAVRGSFVHAGSIIEFVSEATGPERARLHLAVNGAPIDVELDLVAQTFVDDGHAQALFEDDLAALLALRDALGAAHPELATTLHGTLLARHADRLAEAPAGFTFERREHELRALTQPRQRDPKVLGADADGCGGDGATCLSGTDGWDYAVYDPGNDGTCQWQWAQYGESQANCSGRCGAGCNHWFDDDYTWDCFDHDRCVDRYGGSVMSDNANCGDEFWDAADDYVLTYGAWC